MNHSNETRIGEIFSFSGIENLPFELQRNFTLMKDLDQRTHDLMKEIDSLSEDYVSGVRGMDSTQRTDHLKKIEIAFSKSKEYVDDKVQLAMQTYEMVDKHIRKLDSDLARFESDLKEQKAKESGIQEYAEEANPPKRGRGRSKKKDNEPSRKKKKRDPSPVKSLGVTATLFSPEVVQVLDMPVDPNEPTYCICHQVSYGEMIGCDNIECPIEWFHFPCVGLTAKPKGKWYCPKCAQERKKK